MDKLIKRLRTAGFVAGQMYFHPDWNLKPDARIEFELDSEDIAPSMSAVATLSRLSGSLVIEFAAHRTVYLCITDGKVCVEIAEDDPNIPMTRLFIPRLTKIKE